MTRFIRRWPLWRQVGLAMLLSMLFANLIGGEVTRKLETESLQQTFSDQSNMKLKLLAGTSIEAVISEDIPLLESVVEQATRNDPDLYAFTVLNERDQVLVRWARPQADLSAPTLKLKHTLAVEGETFGHLKIEWDLSAINAQIDGHVQGLRLHLGGVLLMLTAIIVLFIHHLVIEPVRKMNRQLNRMATGDLDRRLDLQASVELDRVADSMNELSSVLSEQKRLADEDLERRAEAERILQKAKDQAEVANKAKSEFLATISHEIRNPLHGVLGVMGLLSDTQLDADQQRYVATARSSGEALLAIINDVLDVSKIEAGKVTLEISAMDPRELLDSVREILDTSVADRGLVLNITVDPGVPALIMGDAGRLRQILLNLVGNAIKFSKQGTVEVRAETGCCDGESPGIRISVSDEGIGIPKERQGDIFAKFTTLDASHTRKYGGTGLGLAICKQLVDLMGGGIGCESEPGRGSRFWFSFPASAANEEDRSDAELAFDELGSERARVLLVDDAPANQLIAKALLTKQGHLVDSAENGVEAVAAAQRFPYDIILMDISMPEMDGLEATKIIRSTPGPNRETPIIAMTAHAMRGDREIGLAAGMNDYLARPVNRQQLFAAIARQRDRPRPVPPASVSSINRDGTTQAPRLDCDLLEQLGADTSPEMLPEFLRLYLGDASTRLKDIVQAHLDENFEQLKFETHALGSSAAQYGLPRVHMLARRLESLCHEERYLEAAVLTEELIAEAEKSFVALRDYAQSLQRQAG